MNYFPIFIPFVFGTVIGSFLNVVIYRLPKDLSLIQPRSFCPKCNVSIPIYRNIPVLSFLLQRGRCVECKEKISFQYPLVEILTGVVWWWCFTHLLVYEAAIVSMVVSALIVVAWIDSRTFLIPLSLIVFSLAVLGIGIILHVFSIQHVLWGVFVGVFCLSFIMGISYVISKRQGMGYGDLQLGLVLGIWLGPINMALTLFVASSLSLLIWIYISINNGFDKNRPLPFAPFLVIAAVFIYTADFYSSSGLLHQFIW